MPALADSSIAGRDCPPADVLAAFAGGELAADDVPALENHLGECTSCLATVACLGGRDDLELTAGTTVGRYQILARVGRGSFGTVYSAYDPDLDRRIALKLIREDDPRLLDEVRAMARVTNPHVVAVYDVGRSEHGAHIAMEFVEGADLRTWLAEAPRSPSAIVAAFVQAGRGLVAAHHAGIIHRDFKPDNVLVRRDETVAVTDFGLARRDFASDIIDPTIAGTPLYMAPEALAGAAVDARADVFSFCVALYEALYAEHPFPATTLDELTAAITRGPTSPRDTRVPRHIRDAILAGLAADRDRRPSSVTALLRMIEHDPRRTRIRIGAGVLVAALALVAGRSLLADSSIASCRADAHARVEEVWGVDRRATVRAALEAASKTIGRDAGARVELVLDRYASAWQAAWVDTCEATGGRARTDLDERRLSCLTRRRERWGALVSTLAHPDERMAINASTAIYALPAVETCSNVRWLSGQSPPDAGERFVAAHAAIASAQVLADLGLTEQGLAEIARPLAFAREASDRALEAEARLVEGDLLRAVDPRGAEAPLHEAAIAASAAGRLDIEAAAKVLLVQTLAHSQFKLAEVARAAEYAEALVARLGDPALTADYFYARSLAEWSIGGAGRSLPFDLLTLSAQLLARGEQHPKTAEAYNNLAVTYFELERLAESIEFSEKAIALRERLQGHDHPETLNAKGNLAYALAERGDTARALAMQEEVAAGRERLFGPDYFLLSETWVRLARLYVQLGRLEDAERAARKARAIDEQEFGPDASEGIVSMAHLARVLAERGATAEADRISEHAVAIATRHLPVEHLLTRTALLARGLVLERAKRCGEAIVVLERLDTVSAQQATGRAELVFGLQALARCVAERDGARSQGLLERARVLREETRGVPRSVGVRAIDAPG